jgi:hypothetical protein
MLPFSISKSKLCSALAAQGRWRETRQVPFLRSRDAVTAITCGAGHIRLAPSDHVEELRYAAGGFRALNLGKLVQAKCHFSTFQTQPVKLPPPLSGVGIKGRQEVSKGRHLFRSTPPTKCLESPRPEQNDFISFSPDVSLQSFQLQNLPIFLPL